jgi:hypothetical protein
VDGNNDDPTNPVDPESVATVWDKDDPRSSEYSGRYVAQNHHPFSPRKNTISLTTPSTLSTLSTSSMKSFGFGTTAEQAQAEMPFTPEEEKQRIEMGMSIDEFRKALAEAPTESEEAARKAGGAKPAPASSAASASGGAALPAADGTVSGASIALLQKDCAAVGEMEV